MAFVTDEVCAPMIDQLRETRVLHVLPMGAGPDVIAAAGAILDAAKPGLLIAIGRCGPGSDGRFLQFSGNDITAHTGRMDYLFRFERPSIGIVDGGNEIGIGSVADEVRCLPGLPNRPCATATDRVVLGSVANWGAYGVLAALSQRTGMLLLPTPAEEKAIREAVVGAGAIDGDNGEAIPGLDGYPSELNGLVLEQLHGILARR